MACCPVERFGSPARLLLSQITVSRPVQQPGRHARQAAVPTSASPGPAAAGQFRLPPAAAPRHSGAAGKTPTARPLLWQVQGWAGAGRISGQRRGLQERSHRWEHNAATAQLHPLHPATQPATRSRTIQPRLGTCKIAHNLSSQQREEVAGRDTPAHGHGHQYARIEEGTLQGARKSQGLITAIVD